MLRKNCTHCSSYIKNWKLFQKWSCVIIPRTSTLTLRLPLELIDEINRYAEILRLKPSTLCSMILQDKLDEWVKDYAKQVYKDVLE